MLFEACKIVATGKKWFLAFARLLQRGESAFGGLQDCCNEEKVLLGACKIVATGKKRFLALATMLQAFPKALWPLQCSIKEILPG